MEPHHVSSLLIRIRILIVCSVGLLQCAAFYALYEYHICMQLLFVTLFFPLRNYSLLHIVNGVNNEQREIYPREIYPREIYPREIYPREFYVYLIQSSIIDGVSNLGIQNFFIMRDLRVNIASILTSCFFFEIIYELLHYWTHRLLHQKTMYAWFHKTHHKFWHPRGIHAFYQHPVDIIISHIAPSIIAVIMLPNIYYVYYHCSTVYKQYYDICIHSDPHTDHRLHHSVSKYNFGKGVSLWDTLFHTYLYKNNNNNKKAQFLLT